MNVLSLFDGMSCGRVALERAEIHVTNYYASEIDKYAQVVSTRNYPDIIRLGDVTGWQEWDLPKIDLLIAGSPCQGFSNAGKGLNFNDPRSKLFFVFVDILKSVQPKYFLLENVNMKKAWIDIISGYIGVQPILINSALVSAQNRERLYWTNIPNIKQPQDKGIVLADIIEEGFASRAKSFALDANYAKGGNMKRFTEKSSRQLIFGGAIRGGRVSPNGKRKDYSNIPIQQRLETDFNEKSNTLSTVEKDNVLIMVGMADDVKGRETQRRRYAADGKAPALSTVQGGNTQPKVSIIQRGRGKNNGGEKAMDGKTPSLTNSKWEDNNHLWINGLTYRKLTVLECERLQTLPDRYTEGVSNSQRYKMIGNGWTVDVIVHILSYLHDAPKPKTAFYFRQLEIQI